MSSGEPVLGVLARGDGVTAAGRVVPLAAPGDMIGADGRIVRGPHHQLPPCRHFPTCGGCRLQHLDDESWSGFIVDRIASALAGQGLKAEIRRPHLSPPRSRRRASLRAERRGRAVAIGFNEAASHRVVDMRECHILRPELFALVAPLRQLLAVMLPPRRTGEVRMTIADAGVDLLVSGIEADGLEAAEALNAFASEHKLARLLIDDGFGPQVRWEPTPATIELGGVPVPLPADAFLQATADGEAALIAAVEEAIGPAATLLDLFSGLGTFALALSSGRRVLAAEGSRDAAAALTSAARRAGRTVLVDHRDLFRRPYTAAEIGRFDAVILDPPRAGAKEQAPALAESGVKRVGYVSCNPATFARDARVLVDGGYRLAWVQPVGQFRWSTHVELVAAFERA